MKKSSFSKDFLEKIKAILLSEKIKISGELTNNPDTDGQFPEYGDNLEDNAQEVTDFLSKKPVEMALERTLRDIDSALKRLEEGKYGICKYCDKPIDENRLMARPTSSSCVSCKKTLLDEV
ncbi:MAG: TraR/DksA family transcriptional regulator [Candidatus Magasanikbacteria bacterium]|nr:TraR/DksA family transcriptional regulator [Candidatus Magasanikbacteria bacterium]